MRKLINLIIFLLFMNCGYSQQVPGDFEKIQALITFGPQCNSSWGDDDNTQVFFFVIPKGFSHPIYLRIFDPEVGGEFDQANGAWDTKTRFTIYGGNGAYSEPDARLVNPEGNYKSGNVLHSRVFGVSDKDDMTWFSMGPINPLEGEFVSELGGYVIKVIAEGLTGNDGNLYKYFLSVDNNRNLEVEGANAFTYEYSFRLPKEFQGVCHLYPFIDRNIVTIIQHNFDFDESGKVLIYSISKNREEGVSSGNNTWAESRHIIDEEEKNTTIDLQFLKSGGGQNDVVAFITNEYNEAIAFFSNPIGGPPKYKYKVNVKKKE